MKNFQYITAPKIAHSNKIMIINNILLYKTLWDIDRIILLVLLSSPSVSTSLSLVRVSVSLWVPSSPRTSVPTCSVSTAMAVERAMLADVLSRTAVPCSTSNYKYIHFNEEQSSHFIQTFNIHVRHFFFKV